MKEYKIVAGAFKGFIFSTHVSCDVDKYAYDIDTINKRVNVVYKNSYWRKKYGPNAIMELVEGEY